MTPDDTATDIAYASDHPIVLKDSGQAERIGHDEVKGLLGAEAFSIDFDIAAVAGESGEILRFGSSLVLSVDSSGELVLDMETDTGMTTLRTSGADLADAAPHEVGIGYADGRLIVTVDGTAKAKTEMAPIVAQGTEKADLHVGNPSGADNFVSKIGSLTIATAGDDGTGAGSGPTEDPVSEEAPAPEEKPASDEDPTDGEDPAPEEEDSTSDEEPVAGGGADESPDEPEPEKSEDIESENGSGTDAPIPGQENPSAGDAVRVAGPSELYAALSKADGGETILLEGGNYGTFQLTMQSGFDYSYASEVTIASADPSDPATFSGLDIRNAGNLGFDGVVFDYSFGSGDARFIRPFVINGGEGIAIRNSVFDGDLARGVSQVADDHGWGTGLAIRNAASVTVEGSEFFGFWKGAVLNGIDGLTVRGNDLHSLRMDGLNFIAVQDAIIENNHIYGFDTAEGSTDHSDMIQFWTNGSDRPTRDVVIRGNTLDVGDGDWTQSLFMRNEEVDNGRAGYEMYYRDITIEDNVIVNGHRHGISVGETDGLVIRGNSVLHADGRVLDGADRPVEIPLIDVSSGSRNVTIRDNLTFDVSAAAGHVVENNVLVQDQDPNAPGYYGDVFLSSSLQPDGGAHLFVARPGGLADEQGAGASDTLAPASGLRPGFHISTIEADASARIFDAAHTLLDGMPVGDEARFEWRFSDGQVVKERVFAAVFEDGGPDSVELTVSLPDGTSRSVTHDFEVTGPEVLRFGTGLIVDGNEAVDLSGIAEEGVRLGKSGAATEIPREHVVDLVGAEEFSLDFTLQGSPGEAGGNVFRLGSSLIATVRDDGDLLIRVATEEGQVRFETSGPSLNDGKAHEVEIDLLDGLLQVAIDGQVAGERGVSSISDDSAHGLYLGNPWGGNFAGLLSDLEITVDASDFDTTDVSGLPELSAFDPLIMG